MRIQLFIILASTLAIFSSATPVPWPNPSSDNENNQALSHVDSDPTTIFVAPSSPDSNVDFQNSKKRKSRHEQTMLPTKSGAANKKLKQDIPDPTTIVVALSGPTVNDDFQSSNQRESRKKRKALPKKANAANGKLEQDIKTATGSDTRNNQSSSNEDPSATVLAPLEPPVNNRLQGAPVRKRPSRCNPDDIAAAAQWVDGMNSRCAAAHNKAAEIVKEKAKKENLDPEEAVRKWKIRRWKHNIDQAKRTRPWEKDAEEKNTKGDTRNAQNLSNEDPSGTIVAPSKPLVKNQQEMPVEERPSQFTPNDDAAIAQWLGGFSLGGYARHMTARNRIWKEAKDKGRDPEEAVRIWTREAWKRYQRNSARERKNAAQKEDKKVDNVGEAAIGSHAHEVSLSRPTVAVEQEKKEGTAVNVETNPDDSESPRNNQPTTTIVASSTPSK
ncbi:hypothetical protein H0H93_009386 [Arthromyces matolae]|nr:hypothetical protein H0H93_009386 [Arthromyces matolae]